MDRIFLSGTVEEIEFVAERMRRIRVSGDSLRDLDWTPGQHVRVQVNDLLSPQTWIRGFLDTLRTYSIWSYDPRGAVDLCVLDHPGAGPGVVWAREVRVGDRVMFTRPDGRLVLREDASFHLFVGDETAAVAFGAMLRTLPDSTRVAGAILAVSPDNRLAVPQSPGLTWVYRDLASPVDTDILVDTVRHLDLPGKPGMAYVAGQAKTCQAVRDHLVRERGWTRDTVRVKPFWAPGKRGLD
jgi:NADPH-dependent ferric siderophore reductase